MRGRGLRCPARSPSEATRDKSVINQIMLRFRPIAPRPAGGEVVSGSMVLAEKSNVDSSPSAVKVGRRRTKRKYVRVRQINRRKNNDNNNKKISWPSSSPNGGSKSSVIKDETSGSEIVTLQLLPERSSNNIRIQEKDFLCGFPENGKFVGVKSLTSLNDQIDDHKREGFISCGSVPEFSQRGRVVQTWIVIECMTDTFVDGVGLGFSDAEKFNNLQIDTCPGFISDRSGNVVWVNEAYKKMVVTTGKVEEGNSQVEFMVSLVMKEELMACVLPPAFVCKVRCWFDNFTWNGHKYSSRTMPCDVWKMEFGGFAWKLDVKAALSLGLQEIQ